MKRENLPRTVDEKSLALLLASVLVLEKSNDLELNLALIRKKLEDK